MKELSLDPAWAWDRYRPSDSAPWNLRRAGHLYRRAAFGGGYLELQAAVADGPDKAIDRLLAGEGLVEFERQMEGMTETIGASEEIELRSWWLLRMLRSPHPLQEKLTLFWHNHFATSNAKVQNAKWMLAQNELLRKHALSNFGTLLGEISRDPAMMVWLDTNQSRKKSPNENYARELMELFSLGIGNYTEADVREGARAFTGWELRGTKFYLNAGEHDAGEKKFLGQTGKFGGDDIVRICLEQDACGRFIAAKLLRQFVSETWTPSRELLEPLAADLRASKYDIRRAVEKIVRSNLFFSDHAYRTQIKSPVDFAVGIVRALEGRVGPRPLAESLEGQGQRLLCPPSVKGWDGGTAWINSTTMLLRHNLALAMTSTHDGRFGRRNDPAAVARKYEKQSDEQAAEFFITLFLQDDVPSETRDKLLEYVRTAARQSYPLHWSKQDAWEHRVRAVCHLLLVQPEFQLG